MMDEFSLLLPRRVYAGFSSLGHIDGIIKETGASKVAIFTDKGIEKAGGKGVAGSGGIDA